MREDSAKKQKVNEDSAKKQKVKQTTADVPDNRDHKRRLSAMIVALLKFDARTLRIARTYGTGDPDEYFRQMWDRMWDQLPAETTLEELKRGLNACYVHMLQPDRTPQEAMHAFRDAIKIERCRRFLETIEGELGDKYTSQQHVVKAFGKKPNDVTFEDIKHGYDVLEELTQLADDELRDRTEFWKEFCRRLETHLKTIEGNQKV